MPIRIFLLLPLLWAPLAQAQVNIEKLRTEPTDNGISGSFSLALTFSQGNIDFADFALGSFVAHKRGKYTTFLVTNGRFAAKRTQGDYLLSPDVGLWDDEAHFSYNAMSHLRTNYDLGHDLALELYGQYEFNEFLLLDRRVLAGSGIRYKVCEGKHGGFWFGTSAMLEMEQLNPDAIAASEPVDQQHWRWSSYGTAKTILSQTSTWITTIYYQPRLDEFSDYRVVGETGLSFAINERFSFSVDARLRHDSAPPVTAEGEVAVLPTDIGVKNAISVNW
jgi:hypothetical protein